jgi:hypothetical protein
VSRLFIVRAVGIAILMIGLVFALGGCGGDDAGSLVGKWSNEQQEQTIEFKSDGTMSLASDGYTMKFTYQIDGNTVHLVMEGGQAAEDMSYALDGDTLTLTSEEQSLTYNRVE